MKCRIRIEYIFLLMLFMAAMNVISRYYYFVFLAFGVFCFMKKLNIQTDGSVVSLIFISLSWWMFAPSTNSLILDFLRALVYPMCYVMGYGYCFDIMKMSKKSLKDSEDEIDGKVYSFIWLICLGPFVHYLLNWLVNMNAQMRMVVDFWTRETLSATGQAAFAVLVVALACACIFADKNWRVKAGASFIILGVMAYNLILGGRTLFALFGIVSILAYLYRLFSIKGTRIRSILILPVVIVGIVWIYQSDLLGIKTFVEDSAFYQRFYGKYGANIADDSRMALKLAHLQHMMEYPLGGAHIRAKVGNFAHDIFLDTYDEAGALALIGIVGYVVSSMIRWVRCIKHRKIPFALRMIVLCVYCSAYVEFLIEPVMQGMQWFVASFCLIDGCISAYLKCYIDEKIRLKNVC